MIPRYLDVILRLGRLLGTIRSLVLQTEELVIIIDNSSGIEEVVANGLDL